MSVISVYQSTCRFCNLVEDVIVKSLFAAADFFAVARVAMKAANVAMNGDYEKAKTIILDV